jgi:ribosomal protein S18 acetylase RimI-like enzyme
MVEPPLIRRALPDDEAAVLALSRELIADGTVYPFTADMDDAELAAFWFSPQGHLQVALAGGELAGLYVVKPNQPGRGSHVANAAYAVSERFRGRGIGEALGRHSLEEARRLGFKAMQFNLVVATNTPAVKLWQKLGFEIQCRLPRAFDHASLGLVDAYVMHRFL